MTVSYFSSFPLKQFKNNLSHTVSDPLNKFDCRRKFLDDIYARIYIYIYMYIYVYIYIYIFLNHYLLINQIHFPKSDIFLLHDWSENEVDENIPWLYINIQISFGSYLTSCDFHKILDISSFYHIHTQFVKYSILRGNWVYCGSSISCE